MMGLLQTQENQKSLQSDNFGEVNELEVWSVRSMENKFQKLGVNKKFSFWIMLDLSESSCASL